MGSETKTCQNCKQQFTIDPEDFDFYKKMSVPPPTFCPECRMKRRFAWRNEHNLYRRKDDASGKDIFAGFPPDTPLKIYEKEYWISDSWDPLAYGKDYDFSRPFFEQFKELMYAVPWPSRSVTRIVNSDYCDQAGDIKNCYLCFNLDRSEDSSYIVRAAEIRNSFDLTQATNNELCYDSISIHECNRVFFSRDCESCLNVWFSKNCTGCTDCFGCANLRNKSYCFLNEQLSKEEYGARLKALALDTWTGLNAAAKKAAGHLIKFPVKYFHGSRAVDSSGEYLENVKNVKHSWFIEDAQDVKYSQNVYLTAKDLYDYTVWGGGAALMYECLTCGEESYGLKFCFDCWPSSRDLEYCIACRSSSDCFGCVGVRKKQYCIFNKQYSKKEYFALREKIVKHMTEMPYRNVKGHIYAYGEFFPWEFSPFAYNESTIGDMYPLAKEEAIAKGYLWRDPEKKEYQTTTKTTALPDAIRDVPDSIINEFIECESCRKAYRIVANEIAFLRQMGIPLPRRCVNCRLTARFAKINKPDYYRRQCDCLKSREAGRYNNFVVHSHGTARCPNEFETSYASDRPEIVYCEQCYNAEVA